MKTCRNCLCEKTVDDFYPHKTSKDGYRNECKPCVREKQAATRDPVKRKEYADKYYKENTEFVKEKSQQYRDANLETVNARERVRTKLLRDADPDLASRRQRTYALKRKYGITVEQYEELLARQNYCCALCDRHQDEFKTNLAVDHDHVNLRIRGLLCTSCNYRLVARHRDGALLRKIADYVEQGTEWYAPAKKKRTRRSRKAKV